MSLSAVGKKMVSSGWLKCQKQIHRNKMKRKPDGWRDGKPTFRRVDCLSCFHPPAWPR